MSWEAIQFSSSIVAVFLYSSLNLFMVEEYGHIELEKYILSETCVYMHFGLYLPCTLRPPPKLALTVESGSLRTLDNVSISTHIYKKTVKSPANSSK